MKTRWTQFLGIGITEEGEFEVVNSDMTAERALWLAYGRDGAASPCLH